MIAANNFPGVTVDRKDGVIKEHPNTRITDLPGIYSMSPYSSEEIVTREFLLQDKPKESSISWMQPILSGTCI